MDPLALILGLIWTLVGLLMAGLAIPLVRGRIRPNHFYGVRFAESFQSDEAWFAINRFGGKRLLLWSVPIVLLGVVTLFLPVSRHPMLALALGLVLLISVLIPAVQSARFAKSFRPKA